MTETVRDLQLKTLVPGDTPTGTAGLGQRLRAARRARGLSQRSLSSAGVTFAYICRIERGTRIPSLYAIRLLATALDVSPRWLETGEDGRWDGFRPAELAAIRAALLRSDEPTALGLVADLTDAVERRAGQQNERSLDLLAL